MLNTLEVTTQHIPLGDTLSTSSVNRELARWTPLSPGDSTSLTDGESYLEKYLALDMNSLIDNHSETSSNTINYSPAQQQAIIRIAELEEILSDKSLDVSLRQAYFESVFPSIIRWIDGVDTDKENGLRVASNSDSMHMALEVMLRNRFSKVIPNSDDYFSRDSKTRHAA